MKLFPHGKRARAMIARVCLVLAACALAAAVPPTAIADDPRPAAPPQSPSAAADKPASSSPWQVYFRRLAAEYRMTVGYSKTPLTVTKEPVLKWIQPGRGG